MRLLLSKTQDNVEYIQKIEVVFNGDKDYYFTVTEPTGDWMISSDYENSVYFTAIQVSVSLCSVRASKRLILLTARIFI